MSAVLAAACLRCRLGHPPLPLNILHPLLLRSAWSYGDPCILFKDQIHYSAQPDITELQRQQNTFMQRVSDSPALALPSCSTRPFTCRLRKVSENFCLLQQKFQPTLRLAVLVTRRGQQ